MFCQHLPGCCRNSHVTSGQSRRKTERLRASCSEIRSLKFMAARSCKRAQTEGGSRYIGRLCPWQLLIPRGLPGDGMLRSSISGRRVCCHCELPETILGSSLAERHNVHVRGRLLIVVSTSVLSYHRCATNPAALACRPMGSLEVGGSLGKGRQNSIQTSSLRDPGVGIKNKRCATTVFRPAAAAVRETRPEFCS